MPTKRKGPDAHASQTPVGTILKGNNQHYWMVVPLTATSNIWLEVSADKPRLLTPYYNGESFKVIVGDRNVFTFHNGTYVHKSNYKELTVPKGKGTKHSTLLLKLSASEYIYIDGHVIQWFRTDGHILDYQSPFGNSYVPYAFARTAKGMYLIQEGVRLDWSAELQKQYKDPYTYYYTQKPTTQTAIKRIEIYNAWTK